MPRSSRGVRVFTTCSVISFRLILITASAGETTPRSSMKSPRWESSSSPIGEEEDSQDRKSTRLNSSHVKNSYAVFCLKKKMSEDPVRGARRHPDHAGVERRAPLRVRRAG